MADIRFGTDGIRGHAGTDLTIDVARRLGSAAARVLDTDTFVVGRDTRESGPDLLAGLAGGFASAGANTLDLGVVPTPTVAWVAGDRGVGGAMISASHNPWQDNGIKLFGPSGRKLSDQQQSAIEKLLNANDAASPTELGADAPNASFEDIASSAEGWRSSVERSTDVRLDGLTVVIDAANGAASAFAGEILTSLGADTRTMFNQPDGRNINEACGSTHPEALAAAVLANNADVGIALDGDADRLVAVDANGAIVDGDHIMAILALDLAARGDLANNTLVVTVMSNLGLHRAMADAGISTVVTPVGDRSILEAIEAGSSNFGGEQSGHLIFGDIASTGDGCLSAVQLLAALTRAERSLAEMAAAAMTSFPQVLKNVPVSEKLPDIAERVDGEIAAVEAALGDSGRVLVRASGTEPVVRVMVEAETESAAGDACDRLCEVIADRFG